MAEQNFTQAIRIADRGYVIVHGKIAFEGSSADELNNNDLIRKFYLGLVSRVARAAWPARSWPIGRSDYAAFCFAAPNGWPAMYTRSGGNLRRRTVLGLAVEGQLHHHAARVVHENLPQRGARHDRGAPVVAELLHALEALVPALEWSG